MRAKRIIFVCCYCAIGSLALAATTEDGLEAFIPLDEGTGTISVDATGNGHDAVLEGTSWGDGWVSVSSGSDMVRIPSHADLRASSFTYDLWFEARSTAGNGRIINQSGESGGTGPDVLERSRRVAIRINNDDAVFNSPSIGTRSNDGPPDHWGTSADQFHRNEGPEHLVITHDAATKTVHMFLGLDGQPLQHTFAATYSGSYNVSGNDLVLGNTAGGDRPFNSRVYQFAYYRRALTFTTDGSRNVTGGEVLDNHLAGPNAGAEPSGVPRADAGDDQTVGVGETVLLDGSGSTDADGTIDSYLWQLGDGYSASGAVVTHTYEDAGRYDVTLVVTDDEGNTASDTAVVRVVSLDDGVGVSPSGHYLTYGGRAVLLAGDSGTQCVMQNANVDHRAWIDDVQARGGNAVHVWSFMAVRQKTDGTAKEERWGYVLPDITPWARHTDSGHAKDGKHFWDVHTFDDEHYWPKLVDLCTYARSKGMLVGITVFFGGAKNNWNEGWHPFLEWNGGPPGVTDDCDIVEIATPGTEVMVQPWSFDWSKQKKVQWLWEAFSQKLLNETLQLGNVFYVFMDEHSYCNSEQVGSGNHFREFFRDRGAIWADWGARRGGVDMVYDQRLLRESSDDDLEEQFWKTPGRPFIGLEEGSSNGFNYTSDLLYMVWKYLVEGGNYFHHNDARMETPTTGVMVYDPHSTPHGRLDKVRERMTWVGAAAQFFNQAENLDAMIPNDDLVSRGDCLANEGREYLVYLKNGGNFSVDLTGASGEFLVERTNCRTGEETFLGTIEGGSEVAIAIPSGAPWACHIYVEPEEGPDGGGPDGGGPDGGGPDGGGPDGGGPDGGSDGAPPGDPPAPADEDTRSDNDTLAGDDERERGFVGGCACHARNASGGITLVALAALLRRR